MDRRTSRADTLWVLYELDHEVPAEPWVVQAVLWGLRCDSRDAREAALGVSALLPPAVGAALVQDHLTREHDLRLRLFAELVLKDHEAYDI